MCQLSAQIGICVSGVAAFLYLRTSPLRNAALCFEHLENPARCLEWLARSLLKEKHILEHHPPNDARKIQPEGPRGIGLVRCLFLWGNRTIPLLVKALD
jgi:hypothetical protein